MRGTDVDDQLRRKLQRITDECTGDRVHEQIALVSALSKHYPHSISLFREAIPYNPESFSFTCFQFALDLVELPSAVRQITTQFPKVFIGSQFLAWLADNVLQSTNPSAVSDSDIVLYYSSTKIEHAAKRCGDLVISKWGLGHTWYHGVLEVPENFGSGVQWFRAMSAHAAGDAFVEYARAILGRH